MERELRTPRSDWREACDSVGFTYHSIDGTYWDESRCYRFTADEIDVLEAATAELHARCLDAAEHLVAHGRLGQLAIPVRVLWGAEDAWIPVETGRRLASVIPASSFRLVEAAGHLMQYDAPVALADEIRSRLERQSAAAAHASSG